MRIGLDLRPIASPDERLRLAREADELGLWAVLVDGGDGVEIVEAAALAAETRQIHLAVVYQANSEHPVTLAEEICVLDHLSSRRALAVIEGDSAVENHVRALLSGQIVEGYALAPPPAQTAVPVWAANETGLADLSGDLEADRVTVDGAREAGVTHLFVSWPGPIKALARHLVSRALGPAFPQLVADLADEIDPV